MGNSLIVSNRAEIPEIIDLQKLVANETLGYYMVRVHKYLMRIGVDPKRLRFRQHLTNEMAHYACVSSFICICCNYKSILIILVVLNGLYNFVFLFYISIYLSM